MIFLRWYSSHLRASSRMSLTTRFLPYNVIVAISVNTTQIGKYELLRELSSSDSLAEKIVDRPDRADSRSPKSMPSRAKVDLLLTGVVVVIELREVDVSPVLGGVTNRSQRTTDGKTPGKDSTQRPIV